LNEDDKSDMKKKMGWAKNTKSQDFKMLRFSEFLRGAWRGVAWRGGAGVS
jgi:hypothetical protein